MRDYHSQRSISQRPPQEQPYIPLFDPPAVREKMLKFHSDIASVNCPRCSALSCNRVLSGEIGLGEKQDVYTHIFRPHPFYPVICHFNYFRFTFQQIPLHSQQFLPVPVFLQFVKPFPSILLSVELFLANIDKRKVLNRKFRFKPQILLHLPFSGENEKITGSRWWS